MTCFGDSLCSNFLVVCGGVLFVIFAIFVHVRNRWTRRGIPYDNVHPLLGNFQDTILRGKLMSDVLKDFYLRHKNKPFVGFFSFISPAVMIIDLELIKNVLVKDFSSFTDRSFEASESDPLEYHSVFNTKGQVWRNLRSKLTPTFTSGKMKNMFSLVNACGQGLVKCLEKEKGESGIVEAKSFFSRYTTDVIATCAFGIDGNALKDSNSVFRQMMLKTMTFSFSQTVILTLMFIFPWVVEKLNLSLTRADVTEYFRKVVWDTVDYRQKKKITRNDFLQLMIQLKNKGNLEADDTLDEGEIVQKSNEKISMDGDKFVAQCFLFLAAGFETSASTMSLAFYELAVNPDVQEKVYEEITSVLKKHNGEVTYDSVQEMTYLHMVVQETLRKYPVLQFLSRQVTRPYRLPGTNIELQSGESVMINVMGVHYDPEIYAEPDRFDPERFNDENRKTRPACTFLGFGDGPRNCIGMRMGYLQVKVGLVHTLLKYKVSTCSTTPIPLAFKNGTPFLQVKGNIPVQLKNRNT